MENTKAKKAKEELAWEDARVFVHSFESWIKGKKSKITYKEKGKKVDFFSRLSKKEKTWLKASYKKAKKEEKTLFLKTLIYFAYGLGARRIGCESLILMLRKMAEDSARLGEFYDYLVQYGDERVVQRGFRFDDVVSIMRAESSIEKEYYEWFYEEFQVPPEGVWTEYPSFFTARTPKELINMRKHANWEALSNILSSIYGMYAGHAALGKIKDYVENGGIARLTFKDKKRAARIATLLFEFGLEDISQKSNRIVLGLKETVYDARQRVSAAPSVPTGKYFMATSLDYFRKHGLELSKAKKIEELFESGKEIEAVDKMCRIVLQMCKREYLIMGQKKYSFGDEGRQMVSEFKNNVGGEQEASLISLYDMVTRENYAPAIAKMRKILDALDNVKGRYSHMFSS
ncbi:hypothetical protein GF412_01500 [Candidatus Micrarchaeota archaeon]|nr:hypothetical protein [Candidatus Micrarchaeota archaeon]MBD3417643.1 hypothetical protein [Candidatus Micrarchaeota archaeon]